MDSTPITARSLQKPYHIKGDDFERAYKDYLSDYRVWLKTGDGQHARDYLIFPGNISPNVSIDETSLSDGELYTIISNKDAHGKKGALIAIIKGTKVEDVVAVGDEVIVKVTEIDDQGRLNLSRRDALIEIEGKVPENTISDTPRRSGGPRRDGGRGGHRGGDRRDRRNHE